MVFFQNHGACTSQNERCRGYYNPPLCLHMTFDQIFVALLVILWDIQKNGGVVSCLR